MRLPRSVAAGLALASGVRTPRGRGLTEAEAGLLQRAAAEFAEFHRRNLGVPVGAIRNRRGRVQVVERSRPGEYPRKDTGNLQRSVTFRPTSIREIVSKGSVMVGLMKQGFYGAVLEVMYQRLGFSQSIRDFMPRLKAIMGRSSSFRVQEK